MFQSILPDALVQAGGWTILHSLWQGALITLLLAFILGRTRQRSPALRYQLSVGALLLLLGAIVFTFLWYYQPAIRASHVYSGNGEFLSAAFSEPANAGISLQERLIRIFPILLQVWLIGVAFMGLRMFGELAYIQRLRFSSTRTVEEHWVRRLDKLSREIGISRFIVLKESLRVSSPMLVGFFKPVILLPVGMLSGLTPQQVECVLAHELAHVKRMDYLVNMIQSIVEVLLFFNPAVWWISGQIREEREHCCDEMAIAATGDKVILVKTLAQLEEWRLQGRQLGLAFNGRPQGMLGRVQRLLGGESSVRIIGKGLWSLLLFCMATGLLAFREQAERITPEHHWENIGLLSDQPDADLVITNVLSPAQPADMAGTKPSTIPDPKIKAGAIDRSGNSDLEFRADRKIRSWNIQSLPARIIARLESVRDTTPEEKLEIAMRELQLQMEALQQEMMNSPEMKQIQELTRKYEIEMNALQEKMMKENSGYEKLMEEQRKVMEQVEKRHRELMDSEAFRSMQQEMEKISQNYRQQAELLNKQFRDNPELLDRKIDSLSRIFEEQHEAFEKEYRSAMEAYEAEMEAWEHNPEFRAMEEKMNAMNEEMEKMMEGKMKPMEEQMEKLNNVLEEKFEMQMRLLEEQMEKLEMQRKQLGRIREE